MNGYWDYPLITRGQIFAPVYFRNALYRRPGYRYSPSVSVNIGNLLIHLFVQPRHHHYYWGDFYGNRYRQAGFVVWSDFGYRQSYDPLFAYYQTYYQHQGINYAQRLRGWHEHYERHEDLRPAHTLKAQAQLAARVESDAQVKHSLLGDSIDELISDRDASRRFVRLQDQERQSLADSSAELQTLVKQRANIEVGDSSRSATNKGRIDNKPATSGRTFQLPQTRRFTKPDVANRPPVKSPKIQDKLPTQEIPKVREKLTEPLIPEVVPNERPGKQIEVPNPGKLLPKQQILPRKSEPQTPRRKPNPRIDTPKTPQPKIENPKTPQLPKVEPPKLPQQPKVDRPETPQREPKVERPDTPRQPKVERPETPRKIPKTDRPGVRRQPEVKRPEISKRKLPKQVIE